MGLRAIKGHSVPIDSGIQPADLVRLCPGCDTPLENSPGAAVFAVQTCPRCGLSVMSPRVSGDRGW
jgi:hypothetical protein